MILLPDEPQHAAGTAPAPGTELRQIGTQLFAADVQTYCPCWHHMDGPYSGFWWDTRPWISPHEHSSAHVDMAQEAIAWALARGVATRHPIWPHLIHVPSLVCKGH